MTSVINHTKRFLYSFALLSVLSLISLAAAAQDKTPNQNDAQQKIEALKMEYLTQQLDLKPKEAEKFWPLYNQYQHDMHQIIEERKQNQLNKNQLNKADNKAIENAMNRDFQLEQQALQVRQKYRKEFQDVLPPRKVMKVYRSEKDFNMKLIDELHRRQNIAPRRNQPTTRPDYNRPSNQRPRQRIPTANPPQRKINRPVKAPSRSQGHPAPRRPARQH